MYAILVIGMQKDIIYAARASGFSLFKVFKLPTPERTATVWAPASLPALISMEESPTIKHIFGGIPKRFAHSKTRQMLASYF
jgi:hypothetical protein